MWTASLITSVTSGTAGLSFSDNPDTMKDVVQDVIDDALTSINATMMASGPAAFYMFIKPLSELYLIFNNWF